MRGIPILPPHAVSTASPSTTDSPILTPTSPLTPPPGPIAGPPGHGYTLLAPPLIVLIGGAVLHQEGDEVERMKREATEALISAMPSRYED